MKNKDKYREKIIEIAMNGDILAVDKDTKQPMLCYPNRCKYCLFEKYVDCSEARKKWLNQEVEILDEVEKKYLRAVIKPWRNKVLGMSIASHYKEEYLVIVLNNEDESELWFPGFKTGTMYKGMERHKEYTLEELGL